MNPLTKLLIFLGIITTLSGIGLTVYFQRSQTPSASADSKILASQLKSPELTARGWKKAAAKDYSGALADFTQAIQSHPDDTYAYFSRGEMYVKTGEYRKAIADFTQGLRVDPKDHGLYFGRATAREKLGDTQGALADYRQVLSINTNNALAYQVRSTARFKLGDKQGALSDLEKAKKLYQKR